MLEAHSKFHAIVFDCDGVLVDTEHLKFLAWQQVLAEENVPFSIEEYLPLVGHSSENILQMIEKSKQLDLPIAIIDRKNLAYKKSQKEGVPAIPDMVNFAHRLFDNKERLGLKLALASSASQEEILENLKQIGLSNIFDCIISGSDDLDDYTDTEGKNKPKPYIYLEVAKRMKVLPESCLVFEDTKAGVDAAAGAGMVAIAVPNQFTMKHDFSKASQVIIAHKELDAFIDLDGEK